MPSILTRYLFREIIPPLLVGFLLMVVVGSGSQLMRAASEVSGVGLPFGALLRALPLAVPLLVGMGMPVVFVLALLVAFGRMAEERELLAISASGISMRRMLVLPLMLGVAFTCLGLSVTLYLEPRAISQLKSLLADAAAGYFGEALEPGVLHDQVPGLTIFFREKNVETGALKEILLIDERDETQPRIFIGESGVIDKREGALRFVLERGEAHIGNARDPSYRRVRFDELVWRVDPGPMIRKISAQVPFVNAIPLGELRVLAADTTKKRYEQIYYGGTYHRKFAFPIANLVFVLLVFPITTITNRSSRIWVYLAVAMMVALYFTLAQAIEPLMSLGMPLWLAVWTPNILFGVIGLGLTLARIRR